MKKFLLALMAVFTAFSSTGIQAFASESTKEEEVPHIVIDAQGMTMEELQETMVQTRAATDEYYSLKSLTYTGSEYLGHRESFKEWIDAGTYLITKAIASVKFNNKAAQAVVEQVWTYTQTKITESKTYSRVNEYYYRSASATYDITDALGNKLRTQTYTNLKIATKVIRTAS